MPDWRAEVRARLAPLGLSAYREEEIVEEMAQHLEDRHADLRARGRREDEILHELRDELAREPLGAELRDSDRPPTLRPEPVGAPAAGRMLGDLWRDLRYGARSLRRARGFTAVAVLTLALGVGATTAMFSVLDAVLLRPLPFPDPDRLVLLYQTNDASSEGLLSFSVSDFLALRGDGRVLGSVATFQTPADGFSYVAGDRAERVFGAVVSADFFTTLGVRPLLGRAFQPGDDAEGAPPTAVLGHAFWQRRLGGDPQVVGRSIRLDGRAVTVIGVMPPSAWFPRGDRAELWTNATFAPPTRHGPFGLSVVGRLKPGTSAAQRQAVFDELAAGMRARYPGGPERWTFVARPLAERLSGGLRPALGVLMGAVVLVLLIACVNVANLMLARATSREREIAVRRAMGATRSRIARQLLAESAVLAAVGGAVGVALAVWGVRLLVAGAPGRLSMLRDLGVGVSWRVLAVAAAATMGSVLACGLAPALIGARGAVGRDSGDGRSHRRLRNGLVAVEFALSMMLLVSAGLLLRSLSKLRAVDTGVRTDGVVTASIALPKARYPGTGEVLAFHDRLLDELRAQPGVERVSASVGLPPDVAGNSTDFQVAAHPVAAGEFSPVADNLSVDGAYFAALGVPLRAGRVFDARDDSAAARVVVVSESLVRRYLPGADPIGQRLEIGGAGEGNTYTIVGVVGDVRYEGVASGETVAIYYPFAQFGMGGAQRSFAVVVRSALAPAEVASSLRETMRRIDPELALARVRTAHDLAAASIADDSFRTTLLSLFALVALALAGVGIYGVTAYAVGRRTREIGIRLALGAPVRRVYALVLGEGLAVAAAGIGVGIVLALAAGRVVSRLLYEVSATDALTFGAVPLLLLAIAGAACLVPARRAARVDPALTMRAD
jgi:putative ABC transport system permease protein